MGVPEVVRTDRVVVQFIEGTLEGIYLGRGLVGWVGRGTYIIG